MDSFMWIIMSIASVHVCLWSGGDSRGHYTTARLVSLLWIQASEPGTHYTSILFTTIHVISTLHT